MKAIQVNKPGGKLELVERPVPEPGRVQVRIKVEACGICHSDVLVKDGLWPGLQYPRIPGHEIAGRVEAVGADLTQSKAGQRVGVGWHGGHCFVCDPCRRGDFILCRNKKITAIHFDGGYAEYMVAPETIHQIRNGFRIRRGRQALCPGRVRWQRCGIRSHGSWALTNTLIPTQGLRLMPCRSWEERG